MYQRGAFFAPQAFRSCGKVGIRVLDFHFSIAFILRFSGFGAVDQNPPELWSFPQLSAALACHPPSARTHARNRYPDRAYTT
jgi:hypothetical protein